MRRTNFVFGFIAAVLTSAATFAGTIDLNAVWNGGNPFNGTNVSYNNVIETNSNGPGGAAFNHYQFPQVVGNTFIVQPVDFRAEVPNPGPGFDQTDSQLTTVIMANPGQSFNQIDFSEFGDFSHFSLVAGQSSVTASLNYFWQVLEGNNAGFSGNGTASFSRVFPGGALPDAGPWGLNFQIPVPGATKVRLTFDNTLTATVTGAAVNGGALIAKKQIPGIMITVPEPSTAALTSLLGAVVLMVSRRMKAR